MNGAHTLAKNPFNPGVSWYAIADVFRMIEGVHTVGGVWLGCQAGKYVYGKMVYALENHDFINHTLLKTNGWKACGVEVAGLNYGG